MYPQGVCRIRKPAYAGNGCAIFPAFETAQLGKKIRCSAEDDLVRVSQDNKKVLVPLREQGQKKQFLRYHLVCRKSDRSARRQHAVCPLTPAMRQKILWLPISLCPRRPICCPAFRSALSYAELSVDAPCSFTSASLVSIYVTPFIHHLCTFVKNFFSCGADFFLNTPAPRP